MRNEGSGGVLRYSRPIRGDVLRTVSCDVDGVLFDFHTPVCKILATEGLFDTEKGLTCHDIHLEHPEAYDRVAELVLTEETYANLPPIAEGFDLVEKLVETGFYVRFNTSRPENLREVTFSTVSRELSRRDLAVRWADVQAFGSSRAKAAHIQRYRYDAVIEDNPDLHLRLLEMRFRSAALYLVAQDWNRNHSQLERLSYEEIGNRVLKDKWPSVTLAQTNYQAR